MLVDPELRAVVQPGEAGSLPQQIILLCCGLVALCCLCGFVASQVTPRSLPAAHHSSASSPYIIILDLAACRVV